MPLTFIKYFYVGATLRWLMDKLVWPEYPEFHDMVQSFRAAFRGSRRGTMHADNVLDSVVNPLDESDSSEPERGHKEQHVLPLDLYDRLLALVNHISPVPFDSFHKGAIGGHAYLAPTGEYVPRVDRDDVTFATSSATKRNSFVLFSKLVDGAQVRFAGQISQIFYHTRMTNEAKNVVEPFFLVRQFESLSAAHAAFDPYQRYPDVPTWLCYNRFTGDEHLLRLQDIVCHFAALVYEPEEIGHECIVVRSLDRVS